MFTTAAAGLDRLRRLPRPARSRVPTVPGRRLPRQLGDEGEPSAVVGFRIGWAAGLGPSSVVGLSVGWAAVSGPSLVVGLTVSRAAGSGPSFSVRFRFRVGWAAG
ncbi:hypothetical protein COUCH_34685 [Couchioplanes caeruleus]|uniref:hypothetical protein n=1 Tax=Couchioplanes caeruleus TaxID=56438 RepID=UPI0020C03C55|nr:hypothetical protein [Couchioplanes caeruleus]UQU64067.1 hypothetical protein COUCH_34685 [Couchioplanes caeruleus]